MAGSLRDQLESAVTAAESAVEEKPTAPIDRIDEATIAESEQVGAVNKNEQETAEQKAGRTAGRIRDEKGRLLPGKAEKPVEAKSVVAVQPAAPAPAVEAKKINRPSSWKKDHWESFDKLATENPALAEYINQREGDYAKGVSTYKQQWDTAKPVLDAIAPYKPVLDQYQIDPAAHVGELLKAHHTLVMGSPQEKLGLLARIIQQNKIPVEQLFVRGQDGQLYFNQQISQQAPAQQPAPDVRKTIREVLDEEKTALAIQGFEAEAQDKYPHYETVKPTMIGILQAGLARDLPSAYEAALRLPQHSEIWNAMQEQQRATDEASKREAALKATQRARANAISPKSAPATGGAQGTSAKGLRATLEAAADEHFASRV